MFRAIALGLTLAFGLASAASAAPLPVRIGTDDGAIVKVGEGCGAGRWRGPGGGCNWFHGPEGNNRGTRIECPYGFHIGPGGERCWPNRP